MHVLSSFNSLVPLLVRGDCRHDGMHSKLLYETGEGYEVHLALVAMLATYSAERNCPSTSYN